jgi:hypothetical protein
MGQRTVITAISYFSLGLLSVTGGFTRIGFAQSPADNIQQDQQPHAWRRADALPDNAAQQAQAPQQESVAQDQAPNQGPPPPPPNFSANQAPVQQSAPAPNAAPEAGPQAPAGAQSMPPQYPQPYPQQYPTQQYPTQQYPMQQQPPQQQMDVPARLTINQGTFITVRVNQWLSSDRNQQGDSFFGTLAEPVIVDGVVVAQRGQPVSGRVTEAQKAGRVEGTSKLGLELTSLTLVDGQQLSIQSQMIARNGGTSVGRDVGAVAGTTALGAAVGAAADLGRGAAIGAGAGAAVGLIGVLLTRGRPTIIYPESTLTFRMAAAAIVQTDHAPQAFRYVSQRDYGNAGYAQRPGPAMAGGPGAGYGGPGYGAPGYAYPPVAVAPAPYYYGPAYYPYYPYYYGGLGLYFGPRYYGYYGGFGIRGYRR